MTKECRDIQELHPKVRRLAKELLDQCIAKDIPIKIGETYRSIERQNYLYAQGRTRPGKIVTNAKGSSMSSYHQWRLAFDIFVNEKGNEYDPKLLERAGKIGEAIGLEWGGAWQGFKDTPHFQYTEGLTIEDLKKGKILSDEQPEKLIAQIEIKLNHQIKMVEAIKLDGFHFIKLQDLRDQDIFVGYDEIHKRPIIQVIANN